MNDADRAQYAREWARRVYGAWHAGPFTVQLARRAHWMFYASRDWRGFAGLGCVSVGPLSVWWIDERRAIRDAVDAL